MIHKQQIYIVRPTLIVEACPHSRLPRVLEFVEQSSSPCAAHYGAPSAARRTASDGEGADGRPTWWQLVLGVKVLLSGVLV